jgi:hypothetical protein
MSQEEQDLIRLRAWDADRVAKESFLLHKQKLATWGNLFATVGDRLSNKQLQLREGDLSTAPTREEFGCAIREFRQSITDLKAAWVPARDFGFPVDESIPSQLGGI